MDTQKCFLSRAEAANNLGVSLATVGRRIKDGSIPYTKLGSRILIPAAAIENMVQSALSQTEGRE
jgi:excisionase family DNA binding protein